ncbi:MAG: PHB depolymerase family esterase [Halioglobus sp.]
MPNNWVCTFSKELPAERPAQVFIPSDYTPTTRYPLVIGLHGFTKDSAQVISYMGLEDRVDSKQYILVAPDGTENLNGFRFWNATPVCCAYPAAVDEVVNLDQSEIGDASNIRSLLDEVEATYNQIDDVAYIRSLIVEAAATYSIDSSRIGLLGQSNGGFMALRMACEASEFVTSVVSVSGATFLEASRCSSATMPVSALLVHGDADETISYAGGQFFGRQYPGAEESANRLSILAGCDNANPFSRPNIDLDGSIPGSETSILAFPDCEENVEVELWTIAEAPHEPSPWEAGGLDSFVDWLIDHPRN